MSLSENLTGSVEVDAFGITLAPWRPGLAATLFRISPLPDYALGHIIGEAKKSHPAVRAIPVADHARRLSHELPLVLDSDPGFSKNRGKRFSPWGDLDGMA